MSLAPLVERKGEIRAAIISSGFLMGINIVPDVDTKRWGKPIIGKNRKMYI